MDDAKRDEILDLLNKGSRQKSAKEVKGDVIISHSKIGGDVIVNKNHEIVLNVKRIVIIQLPE